MRLSPSFSSSPHHCIRCTFCSSAERLWAVGAKHPPSNPVWDNPCRLAYGPRRWMSKRAITSLLTTCSTRVQDWAFFGALYGSPTGTVNQLLPLSPLFWHNLISQIAAVPSTSAVKVGIHAWQVASERQVSDAQVQKECQVFLRDSNATTSMQKTGRNKSSLS